MDFEEWCNKERLSSQYSYNLDALEDAWNAAFEEGYKFANKENEEYDKTGV